MESNTKSPDKPKETDKLNINRNSLFNRPENISDQEPDSHRGDSPDLLSANVSNDSNILGNLDISEEKLIKPGLILLKTDQEALVVHSKETIDQGNMTPKELIEKLKNDPNQKDSIYINMGQIEEQYMKGNLLGDNEEIHHDEKSMKKLFNEVAVKHPCKIQKGEPVRYPLCVSTGWFCGCANCKKSRLTELGIGMIIYFKFLKALVWSFFVICLFNIPLLVTYYQNNKQKKVNSYMDALFKTTIGNIGSTMYNCDKVSIGEITNSEYTTNLNCFDRVIAKVTAFGISSSTDDENENKKNCFNYMSKEKLSLSKSSCNYLEAANTAIKDCVGQQSCNMKLDMSSVSCSPSSAEYLFLSYSCYEDEVKIGFVDSQMARSDLGYLVAIIDCITMIIIIVTLVIVQKYKVQNMEDFIKSRTFIRDFTLHLDGLEIPKEDIKKEFNNLIEHFTMVAKHDDEDLDIFNFESISLKHHPQYEDYDKVIQPKFDTRNFFIYDMVYPILTSSKLGAINDFNELQEEVNQLKSELEKLNNSSTSQGLEHNYGPIESQGNQKEKPLGQDMENGPIIYKQSNPDGPDNEIVNNIDDDTQRNKGNKSDTEQKILKLKEQLEEKQREMDEIKIKIKEKSDITDVKEVYITFRNYNIARYFVEKYRKTKCQRCQMLCCCQGDQINHLYYKGEWLNLTFAKDEPSNIKWQNITYPKGKKCCRSTLAMILAIIIILITLIIILFCKHYESKLSDDYNTNIDCSYIDTTDIEKVKEEYESVIDQKEKYLSYCFCYNQLTAATAINLSDYKFPGTEIKPCKKFFSSYLKYTSISIAIVVAVPVINAIVVIILKLLTKFEKNKTLSADMSANMWKMFIVQFINSCLLIIIVNMKIDSVHNAIPNFPFFAGAFEDLDPAWYSNVGSTLLFSMILNIVTPHVCSLGFMYMTLCFRCCDSGCSRGITTKKKTKKEYYSLYIGPEFDMDARYASILTYLYIVLILAPGMPLLYICFFFYIVLTSIVDKIMVLRYYKNPPKYDLQITTIFSYFLDAAIVIHFCFAVWIYGHPQIFLDSKEKEEKSGLGNKISSRLTVGHNIFIDGLFILLVVIWVFKNCIGAGLCRCCCKKKELTVIDKVVNSNPEIGLAVPLRELYRGYQVKQIEYFQSLKTEDDSLKSYQQNLRYALNYTKNFMIYKLEKDCKKNPSDYETNFDEKIAKEEDAFDMKTKKLIKGDTSYNLVFIPEFESVAYFEYLKNM